MGPGFESQRDHKKAFQIGRLFRLYNFTINAFSPTIQLQLFQQICYLKPHLELRNSTFQLKDDLLAY